MTRPTVAATAAKTSEFCRQPRVSFRAKTSVQLDRVKFPAANRPLPTSALREVVRITPKGSRIITTEKRETSTVSGTRQRRRCTTDGWTDFPETVTYCFFASTTSDRNSTISETTIRKTDRPTASFIPVCPLVTYSTIRVVTVFTFPCVPIMEGMP